MKSDSEMIRLATNDIEWATSQLVEVFRDEPPFADMFRGPRREEQVKYFIRCSCAYALLFGEGYATPERDGVALWLLPGNTTMTFGRMFRAGMLSAPLRLGLNAFSRFMGFTQHTDEIHKKSAPMPHYYLFMLGVCPAAQGKGVGARLLADMLRIVDLKGMPAYLETQNERNVGFYQKFGFEVAAEEPFQKLIGLRNWGMLRGKDGH